MKAFSILCISLILYFPLYGEVTKYLQARDVEEKMGYIPEKEVLKVVSLNYRHLFSEWLFLKTIVYYGGRLEKAAKGEKVKIEYLNTYRFMDASTYLDPYNMDSYYFSQAIFPWEGFVKETNHLLERGLLYRTWDFYIPFFLAFNNFYFLKDYRNASHYMSIAARLKKEPLLINLAARFLYESNNTEVAIAFLREMIESTWNEKAKKILRKRLRALEAVDYINKAVKRFEEAYNRKPSHLRELLDRKIIDHIPADPYGGEFYIDREGRIKTTSMFVHKG